jgi:CRISPR-associated protein (TIGR03984 family)
MKANGLELKTIKSKAKPLDLFLPDEKTVNEKIKEFFDVNEDAQVAAWMDHQVLFGRWNGSSFSFYQDKETIEAKYVKRIRIFNQNKELMLYRCKEGLRGRSRTDGEGEDADIIIAHQLLFGTHIEFLESNGYIKLTEEQVAPIILPIDHIDKDAERVFVVTHNYIGKNSLFQATYIDCRFVGFSFHPIKTDGGTS